MASKASSQHDLQIDAFSAQTIILLAKIEFKLVSILPEFRRRSQKDADGDLRLVANVALARKLAMPFWRVMVKGVSYVEQGLAQYEAQVLETKRRALQRLAKQLGQIVLPNLAQFQNA